MRYLENILGSIGHTPLVRLSKVIDRLPVTMLAKVESLNPGGSVKDRVALRLVEDAERRGLLAPGGTIVEATAGNTGAGLALVAAVKGYRCIFVLPDKMSEDKITLLKAYGAEVVVTPQRPARLSGYNGVAGRRRVNSRRVQAEPVRKPQNPASHYDTTGPEIWTDTDGRIDVFVAGMGTGGTISGTGRSQDLTRRRRRDGSAGSILSGDAPRSSRSGASAELHRPRSIGR